MSATPRTDFEGVGLWGLALMPPLFIIAPKALTALHIHLGGLVPFELWSLRATSFLALAMSAGVMASFKLARSRAAFFGAMLLWQVLVVVCALLEQAGATYAFMTGEILSVVTLKQLLAPHIKEMIATVTPSIMQGLAVLTILVTFGLPWFWVWRGAPSPRLGWRARTWGIAALVCLAIAALPLFPERGAARAFARSTSLTFLTQLDDLGAREEDQQGSWVRDATTQATITRKKGAPGPYNVVVIFMESTRQDAVSVYNPKRATTTPVLTELAKDAVAFERAYALIPSTTKALTATLCGIFPNPVSVYTSSTPGRMPQKCLPELLGEAGYASLFIHSARGMAQYTYGLVENMKFSAAMHLEDLDTAGFEPVNAMGYEDRAMLTTAERWLADQPSTTPIMLSMLTLTSHHDYQVPAGWLGQFHENEVANRYLSTVSYVDAFIGEVFEMLKRHGRWEDTVVLVLGDHGEAFREHEVNFHSNVLYEEGVRIPMLLRAPGVAAGRNTSVVSQLDALPTLIELSGHTLHGGLYEGAPMLTAAPTRALTFHCLLDEHCQARLEWPYKYIDHFEHAPEELFNLEQDPQERHNLLPAQGERARSARAAMLRDLERARALHQMQRARPQNP